MNLVGYTGLRENLANALGGEIKSQEAIEIWEDASLRLISKN